MAPLRTGDPAAVLLISIGHQQEPTLENPDQLAASVAFLRFANTVMQR